MTEVELEDPTARERHPSVLEQWCGFFYLPFEFTDKGRTKERRLIASCHQSQCSSFCCLCGLSNFSFFFVLALLFQQ